MTGWGRGSAGGAGLEADLYLLLTGALFGSFLAGRALATGMLSEDSAPRGTGFAGWHGSGTAVGLLATLGRVQV